QYLFCGVNVQHNCAANRCNLSASRPAFQERERQVEAAVAVRHFHTDDLVLNTAKMRDAKFIQTFSAAVPTMDLDIIIPEACRLELASQ
ncbi:hypothetical protein BV22DRAFT_1025949, partial [Leucogyrophana mollusca]